MNKAVILLAAVLAAAPLSAREKEQTWQAGTVLDTDRSRTFFGTYGSTSGSGTLNTNSTVMDTPGGGSIMTTGDYSQQASSSSVALYKVYENYVIQSDEFVYLTEERLRFKWSKPARLVVNSPVQFAVERNALYILDLDGKEHETRILKQVRRANAEVIPKPNQSAGNASRPVMTNSDVLALKKAGFGDEVVVQKIVQSQTAFQVDTTNLIELRNAGISDAVIAAILKVSAK